MSFEEWMQHVDRVVGSIAFGLSVHDLPDIDFRGLYDAGEMAQAAAIIIGHNHPSGDPAPSPEDISVTRKIVEAGKLLDIAVLDHLVIGNGRYTSLKEKGLGFD